MYILYQWRHKHRASGVGLSPCDVVLLVAVVVADTVDPAALVAPDAGADDGAYRRQALPVGRTTGDGLLAMLRRGHDAAPRA